MRDIEKLFTQAIEKSDAVGRASRPLELKPSRRELDAQRTTEAARLVIEESTRQRLEKTARLRTARLRRAGPE